MGFWATLREWSPLTIPIFGVIFTIMGLYLRAELFRRMVEFQDEYVRPLVDKLDTEITLLGTKLDSQGRSQDLAVLELRGVTAFLKSTVESVKQTADQLNSGSIAAAIKIGKHEEQIATLFRRVERHEDLLLTGEKRRARE